MPSPPPPSAGLPNFGFAFDNSFARELDGFFVPWQAASVPQPAMVLLNHALALELGLDAQALDSPAGAAVFAGTAPPEGAQPLAQVYAGHQFGGFSPQLGDGRALLLGEVIDRHGRRRDIHLKGSGRTPFSRGGDGKAALGPVLREFVIGEAMHALGIPTTRALAAVTTGERIRRERALPGAVLARVAASHIRVGTFQFFAARGDVERVRTLLDYTMRRHYPALQDAPDPALALLGAVRDAQASLLARWMLVGFIHGVMNTDNMTLSGETIDYGPCAFMDRYDPQTVFSSIDHQGRYAYGHQPAIARWNLARLAETLLPLIDPPQELAVERAAAVLHGFDARYEAAWLGGMRAKLGLGARDGADEAGDLALATSLLATMADQQADFTGVFRALSAAALGDDAEARAWFRDPQAFDGWAARWRQRLARDAAPPDVRAAAMNRVNPAVIPRNHQVENALDAASESGDLAPFQRLLAAVSQPFEDRAEFARPAPDGNPGYRTFCGT